MRSHEERYCHRYIYFELIRVRSFIHVGKKKKSDGSNGRLSVTVRKRGDLSTPPPRKGEEIFSPGGCRSTLGADIAPNIEHQPITGTKITDKRSDALTSSPRICMDSGKFYRTRLLRCNQNENEREREGINVGTKREKVRGSFISANWSACPIGSNPVGVIGAN